MSRKKSLKTLTPRVGTTLRCRLAFATGTFANARFANQNDATEITSVAKKTEELRYKKSLLQPPSP